ncbi:hypothetical protein C900_01474 [Fulvivirga imtechensis AK7]|uniref:Uncharacterized protein n=1 Tax=Fulvivirga imtechensis AK7 TaxID=1237149 RepID=L8JXW3_9BACT|nr:hypothetical protein C900_01474 [Fulvivirga imtechensis AK7]
MSGTFTIKHQLPANFERSLTLPFNILDAHFFKYSKGI